MSSVIHPSGGDGSLLEKETLGEFLRKERELKKITLKEVSKNTRIREHLLKAIEEDRHELLPSPIYVRGFLSAYARYLKLDPHDVLLRYERSLKGEEIVSADVQSEREGLRKRIGNRKQIWMVSAIITLSLLLSYFLHPYLSGPPVKSPPDKPEVHEPFPIIPTAQIPEVSSAVEGKPFLIEMKAIEETWVKIQVDGQLQTEALFKPGEGSSYQATNRIELLIGNAGGLDLVYNGRMMERFGKSGEVATLVFTPQGVERKR